MSGRLFRVQVVDVDDSGEQQTLTLDGLPHERLEKVPRLQHFGATSNPPVGSHGLGVQFGGGPNGGRLLNMVVGLENGEKRPRNLKPGQKAIYDASGNISRYLGDDGIWHDAGDRAHKMTGKTLSLQGKKDVNFGSSDGKTYLGGTGPGDGTYAKVMTESGPSDFVYARIG